MATVQATGTAPVPAPEVRPYGQKAEFITELNCPPNRWHLGQ